jgi:ketosteroid isomerase-like protein
MTKQRSATRYSRGNPVTHYFVIALLIATMAACSRESDSDAADVKNIESAISRFSVSLARADTAALKDICAPDFVLFGERETYELQGLFKSIIDTSSSNTKTRQAVGVQVATRPDGAWSLYSVNRELRAEGKMVPVDIVESAYLERNGGEWKIVQVCTIEMNTP